MHLAKLQKVFAIRANVAQPISIRYLRSSWRGQGTGKMGGDFPPLLENGSEARSIDMRLFVLNMVYQRATRSLLQSVPG